MREIVTQEDQVLCKIQVISDMEFNEEYVYWKYTGALYHNDKFVSYFRGTEEAKLYVQLKMGKSLN